MLMTQRANEPLGLSATGRMFNSTTPPARRRAAAGNRRKTVIGNPELPYISPISNYSYGSKATNLPKPPRLSETKVRLADAMQAKKDEMDARLKAEEEEREREAAARQLVAERSGSVPSSPTKTHEIARSSREPTVASTRAPSETNDLSVLSGMDQSRTFTSEFVIDPVISTKVRESTIGLGNGESYGLANEQDISEYPEISNDGALNMADGGISSDQESLGEFDPVIATKSTNAKSRALPRRSERVKGSLEVPIMSYKVGTPKDSGIGGGRDRNGGKPSKKPRKEDGQGKENEGENEGLKKSGKGSGEGGRPPRKSTVTEQMHRRRKPRKRLTIDLSSEDQPPNFWNQPFDWLFRYYYTSSRWQIPIFFFIIAWLLFALIAVQYVKSMEDGGNFWRNSQADSIYIPPMEMPSNVQELAERVHAFEKDLGTVDYRLANKIGNEVLALKAALSGFSAMFSTASATASATSARGAKETASILSAMREQLSNLQKSTEAHAEEMKRVQEEYKKSSRQMDGLLGPKQIREEIRAAVKDALPTQLAVDINPDGSVQLTDQFRQAMKQIVDTHFPQKFHQELAKVSSDGVKAAPSWESFLRDNELRLRTMIDDRVDAIISDESGRNVNDGRGSAILSKETVMMLIHDQLEQYQGNWEKTVLYPLLDQRLGTFKASFEKQQDERMDLLKSSIDRQQSAAFATIAQSAAITAARKVTSQLAGSLSGPPGGMESGPYTPAGVKIPDYANKLTGGRVWPYLTSPSYKSPVSQRLSLLARIWSVVSGEGLASTNPAVAIWPTSDAGDCWPFPGKHGTLALKLSESIYPSHITIEHISKQVAPDYTSAPKTVECWVWIQNQTERARVEMSSFQIAGETESSDRVMQPAPIPPNTTVAPNTHALEFVKLGTFQFDIEGGFAQSFELPVDMANLRVPVNVVALVIKDNYGNDNFTCLYRAKVHGDLPTAGDEENSASEESETKTWWGS